MYFRRNNPNKTSIDRAELILEGNLFVHQAWKPVKYNEIKWDEDPYDDRTWCFYLHSLDIVGYLMNAFEQEPKTKYLLKSKEIILSWIKANPSIENQMSEYAWRDHSVANRVVNLIQFWMNYKDSKIYDDIFSQVLKESLIQHGDYLVLDSNHTFNNNHGIFQDRSLIQLAVIFSEFKNATNWYEKAINRFMNHVKKDVSPSGVHLEHSDAYHIVIMRLFNTVNNFLKNYGRENNQLTEYILKMEEHLAHIVKPDLSIPMIGDSGPDKITSIPEHEITNPKLKFVRTQGRKGNKPNLSMVYKDAGTAVIRNSWTINENQLYLRFLAAFHSKVHKHADDLSVLLSIGNTDYFVDSGKYNYQEKNPYRRYFRSTMAHNTITVNRDTYPIESKLIGKSKIIDYENAADFVYVKGKHTLYEDTKIYRSILYIKNIETILIYDQIESDNLQTYTQTFNIGKDVNLILDGKKRSFLESKLNGKLIELRQINHVHEFKHYKGNEDPIYGWASMDFNKKEPIEQIQFSNKGKDLNYRTVINTNIDKGVKNFSVNEDAEAIRIRITYKNNVSKTYKINRG